MSEVKQDVQTTNKSVPYGGFILAGAVYYTMTQLYAPGPFTLPIYLAGMILVDVLFYKIKSRIKFIKNDLLRNVIVGGSLWFVISFLCGTLSVILSQLLSK